MHARLRGWRFAGFTLAILGGACTMHEAPGGPTPSPSEGGGASTGGAGGQGGHEGGSAPCRPDDARALTTVHAGMASDTYGAMWESEGTLSVVFERANDDFTASSLLLSTRSDGASWSAPQPFAPQPEPIVAGPTLAGGHLYGVAAASPSSPARVFRVDLDGTEDTPVALPGTETLLTWPYVHFDGESHWAATLEAGQRIVARSEDGVTFERTAVLGDARPQFSVHSDEGGGLAAVWQTGVDPQAIYVAFSEDGATWSAPVRGSDVSPNVHDARFVRRGDGGLDLYYIAALDDVAGFSVFRRLVRADGAWGPEERLTFPSDGNVNKPNPVRLDACRVGLTVSLVSDPNPSAWRADAGAMILVGDAPLAR